jgi:hypothetical protein
MPRSQTHACPNRKPMIMMWERAAHMLIRQTPEQGQGSYPCKSVHIRGLTAGGALEHGRRSSRGRTCEPSSSPLSISWDAPQVRAIRRYHGRR